MTCLECNVENKNINNEKNNTIKKLDIINLALRKIKENNLPLQVLWQESGYTPEVKNFIRKLYSIGFKEIEIYYILQRYANYDVFVEYIQEKYEKKGKFSEETIQNAELINLAIQRLNKNDITLGVLLGAFDYTKEIEEFVDNLEFIGLSEEEIYLILKKYANEDIFTGYANFNYSKLHQSEEIKIPMLQLK